MAVACVLVRGRQAHCITGHEYAPGPALQMEANQRPRILFGFPEWRLEHRGLLAACFSRALPDRPRRLLFV
jgi:hypothetical protein